MRLSHRRVITISTVVLALAAGAGLLIAGPLNPPGGAVSPTYKTMTEVEPRIAINATNTPGDASSMFRISQPGSYYLTGNIASSPGKNGLAIAVGRVSIDLNGYTISGGASGIASSISTEAIAVRNGMITGTSLHGIDISNSQRSAVDRVVILNVVGSGIACGSGSRVSNCQVNGGANCYYTPPECIIDHCLATNGSGNGFNADSESSLTDCTASYCTGMGFKLSGNDSRVLDCTANQCGTAGFSIGAYSMVERCAATGNAGVGFSVSTGSTIRHCIAENCTSQGIVALGGCNVIENQIRYGPTGIAGIWLQGTQCRAEGNDITAYGYGIYTTSVAHVITKNFVTGATTKAYYIGPSNCVGTIVTPPTNGALISGTSGGSQFTTDPNANFAY